MGTNHNQPDESLDRALAAVRSAAPPEGMEARLLQTLDAQRLAAHSAGPSRFAILRDLVHNTAWLRGALTGAIMSTTACAVLFFATRAHPRAQPQLAANTSQPPHSFKLAAEAAAPCNTRVPHPGSASVGTAATTARVPHPYASPAEGWGKERAGSAWVGTAATTAHAPHLIPASFAPSKPAPPAPLTAQERALVQLVRTATPAQLAALNPATEKKSDADREAAFNKFFAPSPDLVAAEKAQDEALGITTPTTSPEKEVHN